jgi:hypothetical protein
VAGGVAEAVVDPLEMIKIEYQQHRRLAAFDLAGA